MSYWTVDPTPFLIAGAVVLLFAVGIVYTIWYVIVQDENDKPDSRQSEPDKD